MKYDMSAVKRFFFWVYLRGNLRIRLATQCKTLRKFNLQQLATTCESVNRSQHQMNLYFTHDSRGTFESFTLFITVRTIKNAIWSTEMNLK